MEENTKRFVVTIHDTKGEYEDFIYVGSQFTVNQSKDIGMLIDEDIGEERLENGKMFTKIEVLE
jgi:hypothetical protein